MERLDTIDEERVTYHREDLRTLFPDYETPIPGSFLKHGDDVSWFGMGVRVLWGTDDPLLFFGYNQDIFGDYAMPLQVEYVEDRAPADPEEEPMPIWPPDEEEPQPGQQHQAQGDDRERQMGGGRRRHPHAEPGQKRDAKEARRALDQALDRAAEHWRERVLENVRKIRPDLFE